jgi:hypothetical protein
MNWFWSFDWLFGNAKISVIGEDLYGPQDGQFIIFGKYPHSRSRHRVRSEYENSKGRPISDEERKARIDGLARVAQSNYNNEKYKNKIYPN